MNKFFSCYHANLYKSDVLNNNMHMTTTTNPQSIIFNSKLSAFNAGQKADIFQGLKKVKANILGVGRTQDLNTRQLIFLITRGDYMGGTASQIATQITAGLNEIINGLDRYNNDNQFIVVPTWAANEAGSSYQPKIDQLAC